MLMSLRLVVGAMMGALVFIALALFFVLAPIGEDPRTPGPSPVVLGGIVAGAVVLFLLIEAIGYRVAAGVQDPAAAFQAGTMLRAALAESLGIIGVALAFVVEGGGYVIFLLAAALSLVLMAVHAFPWRRPIEKTEAALARADRPTDLRERLGMPARPHPGAIQEL